MTSLLGSFKKFGGVWLLGGILALAFFFTETGCYRNNQGNSGKTQQATGSEKPAANGDEVLRPSIGPVTQEDFNQVLDAGEYSRIHIGAAMPDDAGTGLYYVGIGVYDVPVAPGTALSHAVDQLHFEQHTFTHDIDYYIPIFPREMVLALYNLMREKNFFNLNVTRDPNGGPDRYGITASISGYGATHEDYKNIATDTNVRDTSTPDNAAYFEVMDFIRNHFINWALNNYRCRVEYRNGELISQSGSGCPTLP